MAKQVKRKAATQAPAHKTVAEPQAQAVESTLLEAETLALRAGPAGMALEFEKPILKLERQILDLVQLQEQKGVDYNTEIRQLRDNLTSLLKKPTKTFPPGKPSRLPVTRPARKPAITLICSSQILTNFMATVNLVTTSPLSPALAASPVIKSCLWATTKAAIPAKKLPATSVVPIPKVTARHWLKCSLPPNLNCPSSHLLTRRELTPASARKSA